MTPEGSTLVPIATGLMVRVVSHSPAVLAAANVVRRLWESVEETPPVASVRIEPETGIPIVLDENGIPPTEMVWQTESTAVAHTNGGRGSLKWAGPEAVLNAEFKIAQGHEHTMVPAVLRFLATLVTIPHDALIVHSSSVTLREPAGRHSTGAVLFLGMSGAGKTTTARRLGMEGALRLGDDKMLVRFGPALKIEPFCLDTGGWLRGRPGTSFDALHAFVVNRGAPQTRVGALVADPLNTWCGSAMPPPMPFWAAAIIMSRCVELAERLPVRWFDVAPTGTLRAALCASFDPA